LGQRRENQGGWRGGEGAGDWVAPERNGERPAGALPANPSSAGPSHDRRMGRRRMAGEVEAEVEGTGAAPVRTEVGPGRCAVGS
jgi:hypothetical protein